MRFKEFAKIVDDAAKTVDTQTHKLYFYADSGQLRSWAIWCECIKCDSSSVGEVSHRSGKLITFAPGHNGSFSKEEDIFWKKPVMDDMKLFLECLRPTLTCDEVIIKNIII